MTDRFLTKWWKFVNANPLSYMFLFGVVILLIAGLETIGVI